MKPYHIIFFLIVGLLSCDFFEDCGTETPTTLVGGYITAPVGIYPDRACKNASRTPLFIWDGKLDSDSDGSYTFEVLLYPTGHTSEIVYYAAGRDTFFQLPDTLDAGTSYMWKVYTSASNDRHKTGNITEFETDDGFNNPPLTPEIISPYLYKEAIPLDEVFRWYSFDPEGDDLTYDLWYRREQDEDSTHVGGLDIDEYSIPLDADTKYHWGVTATDEQGVSSGYYQPCYFTTISTSAPHTPYPEDEAVDVPRDTIFTWICSDPDGDALTFDVYMGFPGSHPSLIGTDLSEASLAITDLEYSTVYNWKVIARDDDGHRTEGPLWTFKTIDDNNKPPVEPFGEYPPDDATGVLLNVSLSWDCTDPENGPLIYDVSMGPAGGTFTRIASEITESYVDVTELSPSTEYEWRVSATDVHSETTYGPIWSFTTGDGTQGDVYAELSLLRTITYDGSIVRNDYITARFDSVYAPDVAIHPLRPDAVSYSTFDLVWLEGSKIYSYSDYMAGYFLTPAQLNPFLVTEGGNVPALTTDPIALPVCAPYITSPATASEVSLDGFDLEWHTFCSGTIDITITYPGGDSTGVYITTEDDGFYTFTAADLSPIDLSAYELIIVLIVEDKRSITAVGYDPRSWIQARTLATKYVMVQQ